MLLGSSILPSIININNKQVQLGDIVTIAHKESKLTVEQWNKLEDLVREAVLTATIYKLREPREPEIKPLPEIFKPAEIDSIEEAKCSFCKKKSSEVDVLIKSPRNDSALICNLCVKIIKRAFDEPSF